MQQYSVFFNQSGLRGTDLDVVVKAMRSESSPGDGVFTRRRRSTFCEAHLGVAESHLASSRANALKMVALLRAVGQGDKLTLPLFALVALASAFEHVAI